MQKLNKHLKNTFKYVFTVLMFFVIVFVNCVPAKAGLMAKETEFNKKEQQLIQKIKIIHEVFPSQTDEFALYATLVHRGTLTDYVNDSYDQNFDENKYKNSVTSSVDTVKNIGSNVKATSADILLAATIVMLDSSGWFLPGAQYSDENYKKALAGSKLVGNLLDAKNPLEDVLGNGFNAIFCVAGAAVDTLATPIEFGYDISQGNGDKAFQNKASRYVTMKNVCQKGFVGGTYSDVKNFNTKGKNEEETKQLEAQYQLKKEKIADEIIKLAQHFRGTQQNDCVYQTTGTGDETNWRQYGASWSDITLGSGGKTIKQAGCTATSMAYLIKKSGTSLKKNSFDPGVFVKNTSFTSSCLEWGTWSKVAPNFKVDKTADISSYNDASVASVIENELNTASGSNNQTFVIIEMTGHWVAVDHVENDTVYVMDPAAAQGVGLVDLKTALNRDGKSRSLKSYKTFYATDVPLGGTGPSGVGAAGAGTNYCENTLEDFADFITSLEGDEKCNYKGRGEGTGYKSYDLGDGAGMTTAFGITSNNDAGEAKQVGYTNYLADSASGCTDKEYIDKMFPIVLQKFIDYVDEKFAEFNLNQHEKDALTSIAYGGFTGANAIYKKMKEYGKDSYQVFACFRDLGCSYSNGTYAKGLAIRRMTEYELFKTGNYNADRPFSSYNEFMAIKNMSQLQAYTDKHWPSSR